MKLPLICSAELKIRSFVFVVSDLTDDSSSPVKSSVRGLVLCLETESVQSVVAKVEAVGAVSEDEVIEFEDACCGEVMCKVKVPYCNLWLICLPANKWGDVAA
ncbi:hypothetical protein SASPL_107456 [Salvia splendens]|uniref:Uncharacterized protein n=1 Tax=Salvia splendens TaxID=180675 RepID=A0A8X8YAD8_SALSN|nr:uncharacterized protein LOC121796484 [Salvia splendens]KAG6429405.1 hypothetical protein SASPL_107456 [Salvia splendens]